jgi:hypothetical protein
MNRNSSSHGSRRAGKRRGGGRSRNGPPQLRSNLELSHNYRFVSSSGTATAITPASLFGAAGGMGTVSNSAITSFFASLQILKVEMWTPPASQGSAATCSVNWEGFNGAPNREVSDTSVSVAQPAHVVSRPPPRSQAAFWINGTQTLSNTIFTLVAPSGTIIDVTLRLVMFDDDVGNVNATASAVTVGLAYYLSLDPNATHRYVPVSLTTTT